MENLTSKGKQKVKVGIIHTHSLSGGEPSTRKYDIKSSNCDRGEQKRSILEMHLELKDQQLEATLFIYRLLYQNLMVT